MKSSELEERLIQHSKNIYLFGNTLIHNDAAAHLRKQLFRSTTSIALNYAECRSAESIKDFIHKLRISLKEAREAHVCLRIMENTVCTSKSNCGELIREANEIVAILTKSVQTAEQNQRTQK